MAGKKRSKSYDFSLLLLASIILGSLIGLVLGKEAEILRPFGDIFLNAMFTVVVPVVFTTIAGAVAGMASRKRLGKILLSTVILFIITGVLSSALMVIAVKIYPPAKGIALPILQAPDMEPFKNADKLVSLVTVKDFPDLFSRKNLLPLILFSLLFGLSTSLIGEKGQVVAKVLEGLSEVFIKMVSLLMYYAPIGLCAYFAVTVGTYGNAVLDSYLRALLLYYPVSLLYFAIAFTVYAAVAAGGPGIRVFWREIIPPAATSLATQSSVAALPSNLEAAARIGVPADIRELVLPLGATAHMDGSCLAAVLKIAFIFGVYHIPLEGLGAYGGAIAVSLLCGVVMAGIPGGGMIGDMLIISIYNLPPEALAMSLAIAFLVDPPATLVNCTGDTVVSMMVTRVVEGKDWLVRYGSAGSP